MWRQQSSNSRSLQPPPSLSPTPVTRSSEHWQEEERGTATLWSGPGAAGAGRTGVREVDQLHVPPPPPPSPPLDSRLLQHSVPTQPRSRWRGTGGSGVAVLPRTRRWWQRRWKACSRRRGSLWTLSWWVQEGGVRVTQDGRGQGRLGQSSSQLLVCSPAGPPRAMTGEHPVRKVRCVMWLQGVYSTPLPYHPPSSSSSSSGVATVSLKLSGGSHSRPSSQHRPRPLHTRYYSNYRRGIF